MPRPRRFAPAHLVLVLVALPSLARAHHDDVLVDAKGNPVVPATLRREYASKVVSRPPVQSASAMVLAPRDLSILPRTSPNDVLRVVPGLLTSQHQGGGKADQLFLRGFDADHGSDISLFVDGVPVNLPSHAHGQGYADLHWLIPEAIAHLDVEKGAYDVRHGDFTTAGSVNLVTRDSFDSSSVQYTIGGFPTQAGKVVAQGRFVGIAAPSLPGAAARLHPWVAFEAAYDDGPFAHPENLSRYNLFGKLTYDAGEHTRIGIFLEGYGSGWSGSGQIPARDVGRIGRFGSEDPSEGGQTERQMLTAFAHYKTSEQQLDATLYVTRYRLSLFNDFTFYLNDPLHGDEIEQDDARVLAGGKLAWTFRRRWRGIFFKSTVGVETRYDTVHVDRWHDTSQDGRFRQRLARLTDPSGIGINADNDDLAVLDLAAYAEEDVVLTRWLRALAGVRVDYFGFSVSNLDPGAPAASSGTQQKSVVSPKASLVITPIHGWLDLYVNFGEGFHTNMAPVALADGKLLQDASGNRFVLHAIPRFYGGEVGARVSLWSRVDVNAALWASYIENETQFDADVGAFVPSDPVRRLGFDLSLRGRVARWLEADLDLSQATSQNALSGAEIALAPRLYVTGGLTASWRTLRGGVRFRYLGERPLFDEDSPEYRSTTDRSRIVAQPWFIVDLYAAYRWRMLEVALGIQNLLDSTWREAQLGNRSCTRDETFNPGNRNYASCGVGVPAASRVGVVDAHFTPGVPFNPQLTGKVYF
jgi:hypothetical protein